MPTPNGVNYLLQFLIDFFQFPNCPKQESKVDVLSYVLLLIIVYLFIGISILLNLVVKIQQLSEKQILSPQKYHKKSYFSYLMK